MRFSPRLLAVCLALTLPGLRAAELLTNPTFEGTYASGQAPGWSAASIDTRALTTYAEDAAGRSGKAQRITVTRKLGGYAGLLHSFVTRVNGTTGLTRNRDYEASVWVRSDRRETTVTIGLSDGTAWQPRTFVSSAEIVGPPWRRLVLRFRASDLGTDAGGNPLTTNGNVYFFVRSTHEGSIWLDDASFRELTAADADAPATGNLVFNASFELGTEGWPRWRTVVAAVDDATAPHGGKVLSVSWNGIPSSRLQSWAFPLPWGPACTVSLWMKTSSASTVGVWVGRSNTAPDKANEAVATASFAVTPTWTRYSFTFTPPPLPRGRAFLLIDPPDGGTLWLDGVQVESGNTATSFAPRAPLEAALVLSGTAVRAAGETVTGQLVTYNTGTSASRSLTTRLRDLWENTVPGSETSWTETVPAGRSSRAVNFSPGGRLGAFRAEADAGPEALADATFVVLPPAPTAGETSSFGTHLDYASDNLARQSGAGWTKTWNLNWGNQENPANTWNYPFAGHLDTWQSAGLRTLAVLGGPPAFRQNQPASPLSWGWYPPADLTRAEDYAQRMGTQFGSRVAAWELCNEPDVFLHNNGYANDYDAYAAEALAYATGLRRSVPDTFLLVGSATIDQSPETWIGAALASERTNTDGARLRDLIDGVSFHNYDYDPPMVRRLVQDLRTKLSQLATTLGDPTLATLPIWDTEWSPCGHPPSFRRTEPRILRGNSGSSARQNAAAVAIGLISRLGEGIAVNLLYHSYGENMIGCVGDGHDILHEFDGRPRPTVPAQAAVARLLGRPASGEAVSLSGLWGYRFVRADGRAVHVLWADEFQTGPVAIPAPAAGEVFDLFGNTLGTVAAGETLSVPIEPIYLLGPNLGVRLAFGDVVIAPGDSTPDTADGTHFGSLEANAPSVAVDHTFSLTNLGATALALGTPTLTGGAAADWTVTQPPPTTLAPGATATFTLRFQPLAQGARAATVEIAIGSTVMQFAVAGTGTAPAPVLALTPTALVLDAVAGSAATVTNLQLANPGRGTLTWSGTLPTNYVADDSLSPSGPLPNWLAPAQGYGTTITFRTSTDTSVANTTDRDDYVSEILDLGFTVPFYGQSYSRVRITTNGQVYFDTTQTSAPYTNTVLPSASAPNKSISVLWDDLYLIANTSQAYWFKPDADTFVISWIDVAYFTNRAARQSFQVVLRRDGTITGHYATIAKSPNTAGFCIGLQNANAAAQAVLYSRTPNPPANSLAVRFTPPPGAGSAGNFSPGAPASWLSFAGPSSGSLAPHGQVNVVLRLDPTNLAAGQTYRTTLTLTSSDPERPVLALPVSLRVLPLPAAPVPSAGLAAFWPLDLLVSGTSRDESGWGRHLTADGAGVSAAGTGKFLGGLGFDGSSALTGSGVPVSGARFTGENWTALSVSAWIYLEGEGGISTARYPRVIELPGARVLLRRNSADGTYGSVGFNAVFGSATGDWRTETNLIGLGQWHHIGVTYDGSSAANAPVFYVDGQRRSTTTIQAPAGTSPQNAGTAWLGNRADAQRPFLGRLDHVRIYARMLSDSEMAALAADSGNLLEGTGLGDWRRTHFGTLGESAVTADSADPDGDGWTNLLEYALGQSPVVPDGTGPTATLDGPRLSLTFQRLADPALVYTVQAGNDPGVLTDIWQSTGAANTAGSITIPDAQDPGPGGRRFMRLKVSAP